MGGDHHNGNWTLRVEAVPTVGRRVGVGAGEGVGGVRVQCRG